MSTSRELDVVLWGATGYTGRLVADYLATTPHAATLTWALAGRDRHKLERIRVELAAVTPRLADLPILIGEAHDRASLDAIAARTRVVCTTVGPYARYGSELVAACAADAVAIDSSATVPAQTSAMRPILASGARSAGIW